MKTQKIIVVGSSNTDMVVKSDRLPLPGETVLGADFLMCPGGNVHYNFWSKLVVTKRSMRNFTLCNNRYVGGFHSTT